MDSWYYTEEASHNNHIYHTYARDLHRSVLTM